MESELQRSAKDPDQPARSVLLCLALVTLATGSLLALLVFKGCVSAPAGLRADGHGTGIETRAAVMTDRRGSVVAVFDPGSRRSVSLAPF